MVVVNLVLNKKTKTVFLVFILTILVLLAASVVIAAGQTVEKNAETTEQRLQYLRNCGYECQNEVYKQISIPDTLNDVYINYNAIQVQQGFDLTEHLGQKVDFYTYTVTNYADEENIYAHLLVQDGVVIGGDIASTKIDGFMHGVLGNTTVDSAG